MTTPLAYPLINGVRHDWTNIEPKIAGQIFVGFKSLNYKRTRTRTKLWGNSSDPIAKTQGVNDYTADMEVYLAEWNLFQALLKAGAAAKSLPSGISPGSGYGDLLFPVVITYLNLGFDTITDTILGCSVDELDASQSQSPDPLVRKVTFNPLKVLFNGDDDLATALQAPSGS